MNTLDELNRALQEIDIKGIDEAVKLIDAAERVHVTGVGKSGDVARLFAGLLSSLNVDATYLDPVSAVHGDMGRIKFDHLLVCLSSSGESDEIVDLKNKLPKIPTLSVCRSFSRLGVASEHVVSLPQVEEQNHVGMPLVSNLVISAVCSLICEGLSGGISTEQYLENHPAGEIGKRKLTEQDRSS